MKALLPVFLALTLTQSVNASENNLADAVSLQIFVDNHLNSLMVDGQIKFIDFEQLKAVSAVPVESHPLIFKGEGFYVACVTVIDGVGTEYPIDLYIFERSGGLIVSDITFGVKGREDFRLLAKAGVVKKM